MKTPAEILTLINRALAVHGRGQIADLRFDAQDNEYTFTTGIETAVANVDRDDWTLFEMLVAETERQIEHAERRAKVKAVVLTKLDEEELAAVGLDKRGNRLREDC